MNARHTHPLRLALEITLLLAFILILTGGFLAQARSGLDSSKPAPPGNVAAEIQAFDANAQAALMAAEMAALTPPIYFIVLPIVQR